MTLIGGCALGSEDATVEQAATQAQVWKANQVGANVLASFFDGTSGGYLDAWENGSGATRTAYLSFTKYTVDPTSYQCTTWTDPWGNTEEYCDYTRYSYDLGWGEIPAADAQFRPGMARLKTTLGAGFSITHCDVDNEFGTTTCADGTAGGTIDVRWAKDGASSSFHSGTSQETWGPYSYKTQGVFRTSSARTEGSVLGTSFSDGSGQFGDSRSTIISKSVIRTSP